MRGLHEEEAEVWDLIRPERDSLARLKRASIRQRSWFTELNWKQRRFIDAVIVTVDRIHSRFLLRILAPLVERLLKAMGGTLREGALVLMGEGAYRIMKGVAERIVRIAQKWGNNSAHKWLDDTFVKYLIVMNLPRNKNPPMFTFR